MNAAIDSSSLNPNEVATLFSLVVATDLAGDNYPVMSEAKRLAAISFRTERLMCLMYADPALTRIATQDIGHEVADSISNGVEPTEEVVTIIMKQVLAKHDVASLVKIDLAVKMSIPR